MGPSIHREALRSPSGRVERFASGPPGPGQHKVRGARTTGGVGANPVDPRIPSDALDDVGARGDLELVRAVVRGERAALERLIERLQVVPGMVTAQNNRAGRPLEIGEERDVVQDCWLAIWRKLATFEGHARLETWVYRFCFQEFMNAMRTKLRRKVREADLDDSVDERLENALPLEIDEERLERLLDAMGGQEAALLRLKHFDGLTFQQIGKRLALSPNTAKAVYYRGLRRLHALWTAPERERAR
jgi:RNA polymerase sigma-70 factor (ECF subfamily)